MTQKPSIITSVHNPLVRRVQLLGQKSTARKQQSCFIVEGRREVERCMKNGYRVDTLVYCQGLAPREQWQNADVGKVVEVTPAVYHKMAYRQTTEGVIAIVESRHTTLADLETMLFSQPEERPSGSQAPRQVPLFVVLEHVEKPGNLGAVLRSADAAGADAVIICDPLTDVYNPNLIRSSLGAVFHTLCIVCSSEECIALLKKHRVRILTAQLQDSSPYYTTDMTLPTAIVMGTEATGLTDTWRQAADEHIRIPMCGIVDSLNVSVSAAILLYEAVRQRRK